MNEKVEILLALSDSTARDLATDLGIDVTAMTALDVLAALYRHLCS